MKSTTRLLLPSRISRISRTVSGAECKSAPSQNDRRPLLLLQSVRFQSSLSESAAVGVVDSDEDEGQDDEEQQTVQTRRPRLAELRTRLRKETVVPKLTTTKVSVASSSSCSATPEPAIESTSMIDLTQLLSQLPDLPSEPEAILTDKHARFHNYLRLSLTERCNLRCTYCMPPSGVPLQPQTHLLTTTELLTLANHFADWGVTKFRLTGGEPTLRRDLLEIVQGLSMLHPHSIGMTTNGIVLGSQTQKLDDLYAAGLSNINLSLDTLNPDKFAQLTRRPATYLQRVLDCLEHGVDLANSSSSNSFTIKLNCVVMNQTNHDEIASFVRLTEIYPQLQVRFIEYMPFTDNGWDFDKCLPYQQILHDLEHDEDLHLYPIPSSDPNDTTKWYRAGASSSGGKIGFITSMSQHFCQTCNRLRLTADGQIKVCLFDGRSTISLRDAMRDDRLDRHDLEKLVHFAVQGKHEKLGGHKDPADIMRDADNNRPMTLIGG